MKKSLLPAKNLAASRKRSLETDDLVKILEQYFGYSEFRGKQLEAIEAVLSGRDCFCLMPTGGGKSMCYQIPALAKPGIVLVISPLIALMENQVAALKSKGIKAEFLSSTQTTHIKEKIHEDLDSGKPYIKLLYVTPELVATFGFAAKLTKLHNRGLISLIAIDEAHCISSWGHDFRPSYRKLSSLRKQLTGVPILALTATAVPKVQNDVIKSLCLHDAVILLSSFNRPNIFYEVRYKDLIKDAYSDITSLLNSSGNVCSIIYCLERSTCDDLSLHLSSQGISSAAYHAGLNSKLRTSVLDDWLSSKIQVVVATVAFGMGIDRKDVRIVMHYNMPKSMESFYQESGRAGRDQFASKSVLYYGLDDRRKMEFIIRNSGNKKKSQSSDNNDAVFAKKGLNDFNQIVEYCEGSGCRRKKILESFGERVSPLLCKKSCDSCKHPNLVSQSLDELTRMSSTRHSGFQPVIMKNWSTNSSLEKETEFWNREDDISGSDEDISNSDDEGEDVSRVNLSKISSKAGMNEKFKALERAEEAYYRNKNPNKQGGGLADNKIISETLRDSCNKRLLSSLNAAKQRLGNLPFNMDESATFLEAECFKKYEKVGRSFYNSQMAATIRWLSSCTYQQMHDRLQPNFVKITTESNTINTASPSDKKPAVASTELNQQAFELESSSLISVEKIELPPIPSFSQFVSRKGKEKTRSSQDSEHGSKRIGESMGPNGNEHKKMKS